MNERLFNEKFIFRLSYISLIFVPLILFVVGQKTDLFLLKHLRFFIFLLLYSLGFILILIQWLKVYLKKRITYII